MAARAKILLLLLAALCLPAFAHVPRAPFVVQKPHQGVERFAPPPLRGPIAANALTAPGFWECLYDKGGRSRSTAKERDEESGLDYFLARYYSGALGRFTSADAPFADQYEENPQSWNLYAYTRNNPLNSVDLDGRRVRICVVDGSCFEVEDDEYDAIDPGPGISLPKFDRREQRDAGAIMCGDESCGTATFTHDSPGISPELYIGEGLSDALPVSPQSLIRGSVRTLAGAVAKHQVKEVVSRTFWKGLKPFRGAGKTNGKSGKQRRYYTRDRTHDDLEVFDGNGKHLGSADAQTGEMIKPAVKGRELDKELR